MDFILTLVKEKQYRSQGLSVGLDMRAQAGPTEWKGQA